MRSKFRADRPESTQDIERGLGAGQPGLLQDHRHVRYCVAAPSANRTRATSQHVAVVDEAFVRKFFPNEDPIGQHFGFAPAGHSGDYEIVGVARDTRYRDPTRRNSKIRCSSCPIFRLSHFDEPYYQRSEAQSRVRRGYRNPLCRARRRISVRRCGVCWPSIDPNLSIIEMRSFGEQVVVVFNQERLIARLTEFFSLLALLLASIGLYGVTAYNIARRTSEIGIRMALGANRGDVVAMVLRGAFWQIGLGLVIGIPLAIIAGRLWPASSMAWAPSIRWSWAGRLRLAFCAFIAGLVPGWRAASIEPVKALRIE